MGVALCRKNVVHPCVNAKLVQSVEKEEVNVQHRNIFSVCSCQEKIRICNTFVAHQRNTSYDSGCDSIHEDIFCWQTQGFSPFSMGH